MPPPPPRKPLQRGRSRRPDSNRGPLSLRVLTRCPLQSSHAPLWRVVVPNRADSVCPQVTRGGQRRRPLVDPASVAVAENAWRGGFARPLERSRTPAPDLTPGVGRRRSTPDECCRPCVPPRGSLFVTDRG